MSSIIAVWFSIIAVRLSIITGEVQCMLNIFIGDMERAVYFPPAWFDNQYLDEWITDPLSVQMIRDVDKSEVIGPHLIESPVLGPISPRDLSGGVKTLILMAFDTSGRVFNASACGNNCAKWILKIGEQKDLTINLLHIMNFGTDDFTMLILNNNCIVHNMKEFVKMAGQFLSR